MKNLREIDANNGIGGRIGSGAPSNSGGGYQPQNSYGAKNTSGNKINKYVIGVNSS